MAEDDRQHPSDRKVADANRKGRMGPGEHAGGYGSQRFDPDHHGGSYGGNENAGGGYSEQPGGRDLPMRGQQHMSGRHGDPAYGRLDGGSSNIPRDPTQHPAPVAAAAGARPADAGQNAQVSGGSPSPAIAGGHENERDAPGISTDKRSDDTKP
jgi:hypothetical protein